MIIHAYKNEDHRKKIKTHTRYTIFFTMGQVMVGTQRYSDVLINTQIDYKIYGAVSEVFHGIV